MSRFNLQSLEGKPFELGSQDCFTAVKDFYELNFGIQMPNFSRPNDWDSEKDDLIGKHYAAAGFDKLDKEPNWPPRPADLLVATTSGSTPDHLIIFLGGNEIFHHKVMMLSGVDTMRPAWRRYTSYILRHPSVPDLTEKKPTMDLMEAYREKAI